MRIATNEVCINSLFSIKQAGHLSQTQKINVVHDNLNARIIYLEDEMIWIHISCDNLGFNRTFQENLQNILQKNYSKKLSITVSATHTHHGCDPDNFEYQKELTKRLVQAIDCLSPKPLENPTVSFQHCKFDKIGKSRISNHTAHVLLQCITLYDNQTPIVNFIVHNVHPTILQANTPYFSSEYPGYVLSQLSNLYPNEFFTFVQGAAGDISTRFTREDQTYNSVILLGDKLVEQIIQLKKQNANQIKLSLSYDEKLLKVSHELHSIDCDHISKDLSARELETIAIGQKVRDALKQNPGKLAKDCLISRMQFGEYNLIFLPNELFSSYNDIIDISKSALACYSNGYGNYVTELNFQLLTYETFTDTYSKSSKKELISILKKFGK